MYGLLIKVYNSISRRFDKGSIFKIRAEIAHVDTMVPSVLNLIRSMSRTIEHLTNASDTKSQILTSTIAIAGRKNEIKCVTMQMGMLINCFRSHESRKVINL